MQNERITLEDIKNGNVSLNEKLAKAAKEANSFNDYQDCSATMAFKQKVANALKIADVQKSRVDVQYHEKIDRLLLKYVNMLQRNLNRGNEIDTRCVSIMIAGGSNFPVNRKEKQIKARDKNMKEYFQIAELLEKIKSVGTGGISSDDPNAIKKLEQEILELVKFQERMKKANSYYRKNKTLDGCIDISKEYIKSHDITVNRIPFPPYILSNNNACIRAKKQRILTLKKIAETELKGWYFKGGEVIFNKGANRIQIAFDEKPSKDNRIILKSNGFKWAPSVELWQRQLSPTAIYTVKHLELLKTI